MAFLRHLVMSPETIDQPLTPFRMALVVSLPCIAAGAWRLPELLAIGLNPPVTPGYPSWILGFLWVLVLGPLGAGILGALGAAMVRRSNRAAPQVLRAAAVFLVLWALVQTWIRVQYDPDIAFGGLIWGLVHNLTLTREVDVGATPTGRAGYSAGLILGGAVWVGMGWILFLANNRKDGERERGSSSDAEIPRAARQPAAADGRR